MEFESVQIQLYLTYSVVLGLIGWSWYYCLDHPNHGWYLWNTCSRYVKNPQDALFLIFDKTTDVYTSSRLYCTKLLEKFPVLPFSQGLVPEITRVLLIDKNSHIKDLSMCFLNSENPIKAVNSMNWILLIQADKTRIEDTENIRLEIHYKIGGKEYIVVYPYQFSIQFPPHKIEDYKKKSEWDMWEDIGLEGETLENEDDKEKLWNILEKYAGPLGDFYRGSYGSILLQSRWLMDYSDKSFSIPLLDPDCKVVLTDTLGEVLKLE